jgi:tripartite-type tricarboxylate transporter receptor subunit TctC
VPQGTPADVVGRLNREFNAGLASAKIKSQLAELGSTPITGSPSEFGAFVKSETEKWERVITLSGTKVD